MNRQELASLLSETQSIMAGSGPSYQSKPQLSPRQKFQSQVRTLSDSSLTPPRTRSAASRSSPQLQQVSSLRGQGRENPSPTHLAHSVWELNDEAHFIQEEREVWSRPSPLRQNKSFHSMPNDESTPFKETSDLPSFAPLRQPVNLNDRPKTSRGLMQDHPNHDPAHDNDDQDNPLRPSKFVEGSMNHRSAGVASTWTENASLTSGSEADTTDDDTNPRASPQRSSIDINEFNPQPVAAPTFAQRLFKFGTKAKTKATKQDPTNTESEPQTVKKKRGLRKSMSVWNLHGDKKKLASQIDLNKSSPQKKPAQVDELQVLNDRKRRAEEIYAQQFGSKRRKSSVGVATSNDHSSDKPVVSDDVRQPSTAACNSGRHRQSWSSISTGATMTSSFGDVTDIDLQKRPSRRELEKQNQQLRALLKQQQDNTRADSRVTRSQPPSPSSKSLPKTPSSAHGREATPPGETSLKGERRERTAKEAGAAPASSPERGVLKPLSNTRNVPRNKSSQEPLKTIGEDADGRGRPTHTNDNSKKATAKHSRRASLARGAELPRPVSMILEQDEESEADRKRKTSFTKENLHPFHDIPTLKPTPAGSPKRSNMDEGHDGVLDKLRIENVPTADNVARENWEWPEDVF